MKTSHEKQTLSSGTVFFAWSAFVRPMWTKSF